MSAMNKALSQLANTKHSSLEQLEKAQVTPVKSRPVWVWMFAGFALSLAVGGWAVSQQAADIQVNPLMTHQDPIITADVVGQTESSPTQKTNQLNVALYRSSPVEQQAEVQQLVSSRSTVASKSAVETKVVATIPAKPTSPEPVLLASNSSTPVASRTESTDSGGSMVIQQVELSTDKLAQKAIVRASKAMDANDFDNAVEAYREALRYTPENEDVRLKLAALYYGKNDVRKAFDLLQRGIELNPDGEQLRIALAKFLVKEKQTEAALSPLVYLPPSVSGEYLSLRAALAQKSKQNKIAMESYQKLTEQDPDNARWWLGLAIQQERNVLLDEAKVSYQNALTKVGLSTQSQAFIRDRLAVLNHLKESNSGN